MRQKGNYAEASICGLTPRLGHLRSPGTFGDFSRVDDGYSCIKRCPVDDVPCMSNHTREILYQFRAIPSLKFVKHPIEVRRAGRATRQVSRIVAQVGTPFTVEYVLDRTSQQHFTLEQDRAIGGSSPSSPSAGIVKLKAALRGPREETVRVHIHTKSRTGVVVAHNLAIIHISVSRFLF